MSENIEERKTVSGEGKDLVSAIASAAETLGVKPENVGYKLDLEHFRSSTGGMVSAQTVKIIGWVEEGAADMEALRSSGSSDDRRGRDRSDDRRGRDRDGRKGRKGRDGGKKKGKKGGKGRDRDDRRKSKGSNDDLEETKASAFAQAWFSALLEHMGIEGTVKAAGNDERIHLEVEAERAGRIIGKRGSTLRAIRSLLKAAMSDFEDLVIDVDVEDNRPDAGKSRGKDKGKGDRDRDRDRGSKGGYPEDKLKALARRAAEKAIETGKTITINLELSSYDRRIVHLEVAEVDGVSSQSEEKDGAKYVQVIPDAD